MDKTNLLFPPDQCVEVIHDPYSSGGSSTNDHHYWIMPCFKVLVAQFCACIRLPISWGVFRPIEKNHWVGEK